MIDFRNVKKWNIGNSGVKKAWLNGTLVWEKVKSREPFYLQNMAAAGGGNSYISIYKDSNAPTLTIYKSNDKINWTNLGSTTTTALNIILAPGEKVYLRCNTNTWGDYSWSRGNRISCDGANVKVGGNIMSLLYGENFTGDEVVFPSNDTCFYYLFPSTSTRHVIVDAGDLILPATTLTPGCYYRMFYNSRSLLYAPELPATTLAEGCYSNMFYQCTSLTTAPELPATTLAKDCYYEMFRGCTSLTAVPDLPATTLAWQCCYSMFYGCTSLMVAPKLPATTLAQSCCSNMFRNCTSLTVAPELPATTLATQCYQGMFSGCTNLNYIKCLATDISAGNCTDGWVTAVASSGTFVKNPSMSGWGSGFSGIPSGWTVQDAV